MDSDSENKKGERIQKFLASRGIGSRREVERWICDGKLSINGKKALPGQRILGNEHIKLDGITIHNARVSHQTASPKVLLYHKPTGEICSRHDESNRPSVFASLPKLSQERWVMVGRLDLNSSGLLLFTTDGSLAARLMHPRHAIIREYIVRVYGHVNDETTRILLAGVLLDDGPARFDSLKPIGGEGTNHWYRVSLKEGRNKEVRRLWESQGLQVSRLIRSAYGPITLDRQLRPGHYRFADRAQIKALYHVAADKNKMEQP